MLKEMLSAGRGKQASQNVNKSMNNKEINNLINSNMNNSATFYPNALEVFSATERKRNNNHVINQPQSKPQEINSKDRTMNFSSLKKEATLNSNLMSSIETNFRSYLSLNSNNLKRPRPHSSQHTTLNRSKELNLSNFVDNLNLLEGLIGTIKSTGFDAMKNEIIQKLKSKKELENSINTLKKKKAALAQENKQYVTNLGKLSSETSSYGMLKERVSREVFYKNKEIPSLIREIEEVKNELFVKKNETTSLNNEVLQFQKNVGLIKDEICRLNKDISDTQKEKENAKNSIILLKKHILIIQEKIYQEETKSKEFLNNVSSFVDRSLKHKK